MTQSPATLWMVLLRKHNGQQVLETWIAPEGRNGLRRIFRVREPQATVVSATTFEALSQLKASERPGMWSKMTRGALQAVLVNAGGDVPSLITVQAHSSEGAAKVAQEAGFGAMAAVEMEAVHAIMARMRGIMHATGEQVDRDLIRNPPSHTGYAGPTPEELMAMEEADNADVWNRVSNRTGAR